MNAAATGLTAQRQWMNLIANNLANMNDVGGVPYRSLEPVLQATYGPGGTVQGVRVAGVAASAAPPKMVYEPGVAGANAAGYVAGSNVSMSVQMVDLLAAGRAYQAAATSFQAAKAESQAALQI